MKTIIKKACLDDLEDLVSIEKSCFDKAEYPLMTKQNFKHLLLRGNASIKIIFADKVASGMFVVFFRKNSHYGRLYSIAVLPEFQGKDLGKKLFEHMLKDIKSKGLKGILLEIREDNIRHKERYLKLGFKVIKTLKDYYPDGASGIKLKLDFN